MLTAAGPRNTGMNETRKHRWESVIQKKASEYIQENADPSSLITVTRVEMDHKGKSARILLSILPDSRQDQAIAFMKRHEGDIRHLLMQDYPGFVPHLECDLDRGERNRQHIDELFSDLEDTSPRS